MYFHLLCRALGSLKNSSVALFMEIWRVVDSLSPLSSHTEIQNISMQLWTAPHLIHHARWGISSISGTDWQLKYIHQVSQVTTLSWLLCTNTWDRSDSWRIGLWTENIWNKKLVKIYHSNQPKATLKNIKKYLYVLGFA